MRASTALAIFLVLPIISFAGRNKPVDAGHAENASVSIQATPYVDKESIKQALGTDLGGLYTVLQVTVTPKSGKITVVDPDDFMLRTDKDGERTHPMAPNQVAGGADMVVHGVLTPTVGTQNNGLVWGGMTPPGSGGKKPRKGDDESSAKAPAVDPNTNNEQTLTLLREKSLAYAETDKPVTGFLVFNLEKQKVKDLEMVYTTPEGPLRIRFR